MKKVKLLKNVGIVIGVLSVLFAFFFLNYKIYNSLVGPIVNLTERKYLSNAINQCIIKKYGENKYKIIRVDYEYDMRHIFDHSTKTGYLVQIKNGKDYVFIDVEGVYPNITNIHSTELNIDCNINNNNNY